MKNIFKNLLKEDPHEDDGFSPKIFSWIIVFLFVDCVIACLVYIGWFS